MVLDPGLGEMVPVRDAGPLAQQWDGANWSLVSPARPMAGVSCVAENVCVGVGTGDEYSNMVSQENEASVEEWNGQTWSPMSVPHPLKYLDTFEGVSCVSTTCAAVGRWVGFMTVAGSPLRLACRPAYPTRLPCPRSRSAPGPD